MSKIDSDEVLFRRHAESFDHVTVNINMIRAALFQCVSVVTLPARTIAKLLLPQPLASSWCFRVTTNKECCRRIHAVTEANLFQRTTW